MPVGNGCPSTILGTAPAKKITLTSVKRLTMTSFFRTDPLLYHKSETMVIEQETYIQFLAQETRIARQLFIINFFDPNES